MKLANLIITFLSLSTPILASTSPLEPRAGNGITCNPTNTPNRCVLTYLTNSGGVINVQAPEPIWGNIEVYSPACNLWGGNLIPMEGQWPIQAAGLSLKHPLMFGTEQITGKKFRTPKFTYNGKTYGYRTYDCWCWSQNESQGTTGCTCLFGCVPFPLDFKERDEIGVEE